MASYYYLVASLPMLRFDADPPLDPEDFLSACRQSVSKHDFELIESVVSGSHDGSAVHNRFIGRWNTFLGTLGESLHEHRAANLGLTDESGKAHADRDLRVDETVRSAMQAENPLEAELILLRLKWDMAGTLGESHVFDVEVLLTYAIQLLILERKARFVPMEGNAEFKHLFSNLQSIIKSI